MTVANQTNRIAAVGNAAIGQEVPFDFPIKATSDLLVKKRVIATGVETLLYETTNYTVEISGDIGGTLTTVTAIEVTEQIHIIRNTPKTQSLDLETGGSFNAENIEDALDKNTKLVIQNADLLANKAILFPETDASSLTTVLPSSVDRASKNLTFDSDGNVAVSASVEEGSVSFTAFGTNMAETANVKTARVLLDLGPIDVRDYGALGDGVTDDTAAINLAITAAATDRLAIYWPSGDYLITEAITMGVYGLWFGNGRNTSVIMLSGVSAKINLEDSVTMRDMRIKGDDTADQIGIDCDGDAKWTLQNVRVDHCDTGVSLGVSWGGHFISCQILNNVSNGIAVLAGGNSKAITFEGGQLAGNDVGFLIAADLVVCKFSGTVIQGNTSYGIRSLSGVGITLHSLELDSCHFEADGTGGEMSIESNIKGFNVRNCIIDMEDTNGKGIFLDGNCDNVVIQTNKFSGGDADDVAIILGADVDNAVLMSNYYSTTNATHVTDNSTTGYISINDDNSGIIKASGNVAGTDAILETYNILVNNNQVVCNANSVVTN